MIGLDCGHVFCNDCWVNHITAKLDTGVTLSNCLCHYNISSTSDIECMKCDIQLTLEFVEEQLKAHPTQCQRYHHLALTQLVEVNAVIYCN